MATTHTAAVLGCLRGLGEGLRMYQIARAAGLSRAATSRALTTLRRRGLVACERQGGSGIWTAAPEPRGRLPWGAPPSYLARMGWPAVQGDTDPDAVLAARAAGLVDGDGRVTLLGRWYVVDA